jgi:hypothetical protein
MPTGRPLAGCKIGGVGENLDRDDQRGILKVYFKWYIVVDRVVLDRRADGLVDFHRVERKAFVGARRAHAKATGAPMRARDRDRLALYFLDIARNRAAQRKILQSEKQRGALGRDRLVDLLGKLDDKPRPLATHRAQLEIGKDCAQVALQLIDEAPLVAPLERNFVVSSDQVTHRDRLHPQGSRPHHICGEPELIHERTGTDQSAPRPPAPGPRACR